MVKSKKNSDYTIANSDLERTWENYSIQCQFILFNEWFYVHWNVTFIITLKNFKLFYEGKWKLS